MDVDDCRACTLSNNDTLAAAAAAAAVHSMHSQLQRRCMWNCGWTHRAMVIYMYTVGPLTMRHGGAHVSTVNFVPHPGGTRQNMPSQKFASMVTLKIPENLQDLSVKRTAFPQDKFLNTELVADERKIGQSGLLG